MNNNVKVIVNQLGYRTSHGRKRVLVPDVPEACGIMGDAIVAVLELNDFSKYGLNDPRQLPFHYRTSMKRQTGDFGKWLEGDFSHITTPGVYQAFCGNTPLSLIHI